MLIVAGALVDIAVAFVDVVVNVLAFFLLFFLLRVVIISGAFGHDGYDDSN